MERIYYPDHDKRYAHLPPDERWKYPDEVRIGGLHVKRVKKSEDILIGKDVPGFIDPGLYAIDVPITDACEP